MRYTKNFTVDRNNLIHSLLKNKGIKNPEFFINIDETAEIDCDLLENIEAGCQTVIDHIEKKTPIFIVVDSDADGYMSAAIIYSYLKEISPDADIRWGIHEGKHHGIILESIPENVGLVIVPDAGSNDYAEHKALKEMGVDVVVIDHHLADKVSEDAIIINNQLCDYPNKGLSGGGLAYKFVQKMDKMLGKKLSEKYIDMAAVAIVGDMMDLSGEENRYLVKKGLSNITNFGLETFIEKQAYSIGDTSRITPTKIAFYIVPLINALIRVGTQSDKKILFRAFIEGEKEVPSTKRGAKGQTETIAEQAARVCTNAKSRQNTQKEKIIESLTIKIENEGLYNNQVIFIALDDDELFNSTLSGVVAMNFVSKYKKPVIVARKNAEGFWSGSARALNNTELDNFKEFLNESKMFEYAAGHASAFGMSIHDSKVEKFIKYANEKLANIDFGESSYEADLVYSNTDDIYQDVVEIGNLSELWGQGIKEPLIVVEQINLTQSDVSFIGQTANTVKFNHRGITFISFKNQSLKEKLIQLGDEISITVIGEASINYYNGMELPQILIRDYSIRSNRFDF